MKLLALAVMAMTFTACAKNGTSPGPGWNWGIRVKYQDFEIGADFQRRGQGKQPVQAQK